MSTLDTLAPDQRAVLELVLRQGRSYGELAELLDIPEREVRARADAGLRALAGDPPAGVDSGRIADWLLGQQREVDAERTRAAVDRSEGARAWAAAARERLDELRGPRAPEPPAARPRASRLGGVVVIAVVALLVAGGLYLVLQSGDDDEPSQAAQREQATQEAATEPQQTGNDIVLTGRGDTNAQGLMRLFRRDDGTVQFAIAAENVPPQRERETYAVWFTRAGGEARRLGFTQVPVGEDGILTTGGPQQGDEDAFPRWFATYDKVLVTRETRANPRRPGTVVLEGDLP